LNICIYIYIYIYIFYEAVVKFAAVVKEILESEENVMVFFGVHTLSNVYSL
jgi:hypothetical protein